MAARHSMKSCKKTAGTFLVARSLLAGSIGAFGQARISKTAAKSNEMTAALYPLEDLRPGMKGVARSVFSGSEPEEFGLEILGVLPGFTGPRQSTIIARLSGPKVDKTGASSVM